MIRNLLTKIISASIKKFSAGIISIVFSFFFFITSVMAAEYTVKSIYSGGYVSRTLQIHNGQVVWANLDGNYFDHIYLYDGTQTKKLTNNRYSDSWPRIHNGQVAWTGYDGNDYEIYLYDGSLVKQLTNNNDDDSMMGFRAFHNGQIVWTHWDGNFAQIWLYDGSKVIPLTFGSGYVNSSPQIHNGQVVWRRYNFPGSPESEYQELLLYDGTRRITLAKIKGPGPFYTDYQIHNGQVVWRDWDGNDREIYLYDGSLVKQLTNNNDDDDNVMIHNGQIVWMHWDGNDYEIYLYDGTHTMQLTNNNDDDFDPQIHNGQIVWTHWDGDGNFDQIYLYDGTHTMQLTNNNDYDNYDPQIHNGQIVWKTRDGNDYEILLATPVTAGQPVLEILDGSDFSAGPEVSSEPTELASGGAAVEGAVTDGVTRLLLRLPLSQLNEVTFSLEGGTGKSEEDGILRSIERNPDPDNTPVREGKSIPVTSSDVSGKEYAFAIYKAPENFVRSGHEEKDKTVSERFITLKVKSNRDPSFEFTQEIKLVRPPLILVHGLWSSKEMWDIPEIADDFKGMLEVKIPGIYILAENYANSASFEYNKEVIMKHIITAKKAFKSKKIAMVQADVLGHSMGGILARIWAGRGKKVYTRDNNFEAGDINKLITLDSPHKGGFLADFALQFIKDATAGKFNDKDSGIFKLAAFILLLLDNGALSDLATTSNEITLMNKIDIKPYFHAIAGDFILDSFIADDGEKGYIFPDNVLGKLHAVLMALGYNTAPYITTENSDLVVSLDSQKGGASGSNLSVYNHHHIAATTETVLNRVIGLLNVDLVDSNDFSRSISK